MIITKIRLRNDKNVEYIIIKYSKSEKKLLPKIFDINYQFSQENNEEIINSNNNNNKNIDINDMMGKKTKLLQTKIISILILEMIIIIIKFKMKLMTVLVILILT
jgi:hypothetical protein